MAPKKRRTKAKKVAKSKRRLPQARSQGSGGTGGSEGAATAGDERHQEDNSEVEELFDRGHCYAGDGVDQDYDEAARCFRQAAEMGHVRAQFGLGVLYQDGAGVPQDFVEAARWYRLSAEQGYAVAQCNLANLYRQGSGVPQDSVEAVRLYRLAADAGFVAAHVNLGCCYRDGEGVEQDDTEAALLLELAAAQDHADAQCALGCLYLDGRGVPQDFSEGLRLLEVAADNGSATACVNLGHVYERGIGVEKNLALAKQYYRRAGKIDGNHFKRGQTPEEAMKEQLYKIKHTCASCEKVGDDLKVCTRCKGPRYCGLACQKADWPDHKRVCQRLAKAEESDQNRMAQDE